MLSLADRRLYGIVDLGYLPSEVEKVNETARAMLAGGIDVLQLRAKDISEAIIAKIGRAIMPLARAAGVPLIINDYPQLAADLDADGVHLGQEDGDLDAARAIVGPEKIVGRSTHSPLTTRGLGIVDELAQDGFLTMATAAISNSARDSEPMCLKRSTE